MSYSYRATNVQSIFNAFENTCTVYSSKVKVKTDNELWLDRINMISINEFQHTSSGWYGQVYKIKVKTEPNEFAVKFVSDTEMILKHARYTRISFSAIIQPSIDYVFGINFEGLNFLHQRNICIPQYNKAG